MSFQNSMDDLNKNVDHIQVPNVDFGSLQVDGYNISSLVEWFFKLPRYGTNFKKTNVTLLNEKEYAESIAIYGAIVGIVAASLTIFLVIFCCCNCMFRSAAPRTYKSKGQRGSSGNSFFCGAFVFIIAILGAGTFVVGFIGETRLYKGADSACQTINHFDDKARVIQSDTQRIKQELYASIELVNGLDEPIKKAINVANTVNNDGIKQQLEAIHDQYATILQQVIKANETISEQIMQTEILDDMVKYIGPVREECPNVAKYLRLGNLLVLIILAISSLIFILGLCNNCFRSITTLIGYIMFNILIVFGVLSFLFLIVGSDFCLNSKSLVQKHAPTDIKTTVIDYYLYCNQTTSRHLVKRDILFDLIDISQIPTMPDITNSSNIGDLFDQIQDFINEAANYTGKFNQTLQELEDAIPLLCPSLLHGQGVKDDQLPALCNELKDQVVTIKEILVGSSGNNDSLLSKMQTVSKSVSSIVGVVNCESITEEINLTLSNVCQNVYEAFFFFLVNSLAAVLCFYLLLIFSIWMLFT